MAVIGTEAGSQMSAKYGERLGIDAHVYSVVGFVVVVAVVAVVAVVVVVAVVAVVVGVVEWRKDVGHVGGDIDEVGAVEEPVASAAVGRRHIDGDSKKSAS